MRRDSVPPVVSAESKYQRIFCVREAAPDVRNPPGTEPNARSVLQRSHPDDVTFSKTFKACGAGRK